MRGTLHGALTTQPPVLKPEEARRLAAIAPDGEFGAVLMYGSPSRWLVLAFGWLGPLIFGFGGVGAMASGLGGYSGNGTSLARPDLYLGIALVVFALLQVVLIVWWVWKNSFEWRFFEQGVVKWRRSRGEVSRLAYLDVTGMLYTRTRQRVHGVYIGTSCVIKLEVPKGMGHKPVKHSFKHREKGQGFLKRTIVGMDPMDLVRDAVAQAVAERLAVEVAEKGTAAWTPRVRFTREGLAVKKLVGGERLLAYEKVRWVGLPNDQIGIQAEGEARAALVLDEKSKNFWPGLVLFQRLVGGAGEGEGDGEWVEEVMEED